MAVLVAHLCSPVLAAAVADIVADSAADVCAPTADPCNVTGRVEMVAGSVLDFGLRTVVVSGSGEFDFLDRRATVLAGPVILGGNGIGAASGASGAVVTINARRGCSAAPLRACLSIEECELGACSGFLTCVRDASVVCASNADCDLGTCSVGAGTLAINAVVDGKADSAAYVEMTAAGDFAVNATIDVSGTGAWSDGGSVVLQSGAGSLSVGAPIKAGGGGYAFGGEIDLTAAGDVSSSAVLDVSGGDGDGGSVTADAGRDLAVSAEINASSVSGAGYGGYIDLSAGRDISIDGTSSNYPTILRVLGHKNDEIPASAGDGGEISLYAARDISVARYVHMLSDGAIPEGYGGDITLDADGAVTVAGVFHSNADGNDADGGSVTLGGRASLVTAATTDVEVDGGNGGYIVATSAGPIALGGSFLIGARINGGTAGSLSVTSGGDAAVSASVTALKQSGTVDFQACRLTLESSADVNNNTVNGSNRLLSRESMKLLDGSAVSVKVSGSNTLVYRSAAKPPVVLGSVTPAAALQLDQTLAGCPVCGNAEVDATETCDDGNSVGGDGCSQECQIEACVAQTTGGYPANPLCFDANDCTTDICNEITKTCDHVADDGACQDGDECTINSCSLAGGCVERPSGLPGCAVTTTTLPVVLCGDANGNGVIQASDALLTLRSAVGSMQCDPALCDVNDDARITASDALSILRFAVGQPIVLHCPAPTASTSYFRAVAETSTTTETASTRPVDEVLRFERAQGAGVND